MDAAIFTDEALGLGALSPLTLDERFHYDPSNNLVFIDFEGLMLETLDEAAELATGSARSRLSFTARPRR